MSVRRPLLVLILLLIIAAPVMAQPSVVNIVRFDPFTEATNAATVTFEVIFDEAVSGVDVTDFAIVAGATFSTAPTVTGVTQINSSTYRVSVGTGLGDGLFRLDLFDDDSIINVDTDPLGGAGAGNGSFSSGQTYTIDKTPPTVTSVTLDAPSPTSGGLLPFRVIFSTPVTGVDVTDFTPVAVAGTFTTLTVEEISGSSTSYTVRVRTDLDETASTTGEIRLDVLDDNTITDAAGNTLGAAFSTGATYEIDVDTPLDVTIDLSPAVQDPTDETFVAYDVVFTDVVEDFSAEDVQISGINGATVFAITGSDNVYTVTINTNGGTGTLSVSIPAGGVTNAEGETNNASTSTDNTVRVEEEVTPEPEEDDGNDACRVDGNDDESDDENCDEPLDDDDDGNDTCPDDNNDDESDDEDCDSSTRTPEPTNTPEGAELTATADPNVGATAQAGTPAVIPSPTLGPPQGNVQGEPDENIVALSIRTGPFVGASRIGVAFVLDSPYNVLARNRNAGSEFDWYLIDAGNVTGWVSGRYFVLQGDTAQIPDQSAAIQGFSTLPDTGVTLTIGQPTTLYAVPSPSGPVRAQVNTIGTTLQVLARTRQDGQNHWLFLRIDDIYGWTKALQLPYQDLTGNIENVPLY